MNLGGVDLNAAFGGLLAHQAFVDEVIQRGAGDIACLDAPNQLLQLLLIELQQEIVLVVGVALLLHLRHLAGNALILL